MLLDASRTIGNDPAFSHLGSHCIQTEVGVSTHSLYAWKRKFAKALSGNTEKDAEIRRLKRELARVSEGRDILKKATAYFAKDARRQGSRTR